MINEPDTFAQNQKINCNLNYRKDSILHSYVLHKPLRVKSLRICIYPEKTNTHSFYGFNLERLKNARDSLIKDAFFKDGYGNGQGHGHGLKRRTVGKGAFRKGSCSWSRQTYVESHFLREKSKS
jgi:hypothetical protein